jgi:ATP-dependent Clp protease adapter protein ClpS
MSSRPPSRRNHSGPSNPAVTRYKVFLLRPADQDLVAVVRAVMDLTHYGSAEAEFRMWEAHHRGRSVVLVTHLERAELYAEQFADRGLRVCIEPE